MSQESAEWLNQNVLVGFTNKRGTAWHYRADLQSSEPNHYPDAIPVPDVLRRLFYWQAIECPISVETPIGSVVQNDRKAIVRNDTFQVLGLFKEGYRPHQYSKWLLDNVANILDDSLAIGSAGLLRGGAQAWVQVEVPENIETSEGVVFRPNLTACTSFDGSLATTYKRMITNVVCDNTMANGLSESGQQVKVKHSRNSEMRIESARDALAIVYSAADDFMAEVTKLCNVTVTEKQWDQLLENIVNVPTERGRGQTMAQDKQTQLQSLYHHDNRVSPWTGTAWGVVQAFNTYEQHVKNVRGAGARYERNMVNGLSGKLFDAENQAMRMLAGVGVSVGEVA